MFLPSYRLGITPVLVYSLLWQGYQSWLPMNSGDHEMSTAETMVDAIEQIPPSRVSLTSKGVTNIDGEYEAGAEVVDPLRQIKKGRRSVLPSWLNYRASPRKGF
jgi:hypothetical protein